jgi:hypothetical protein
MLIIACDCQIAGGYNGDLCLAASKDIQIAGSDIAAVSCE